MANPAYLNDDWTNQVGQLGALKFAETARELILTAPTPFALAIGGRWGSGKTSMLRTLMRALGGQFLVHLGGEGTAFEEHQPPIDDALDPSKNKELKKRLKNVRTVWFNPWQFQHEPNPLVPLLQEIREQVRYQFLRGGAKQLANLVEAGIQSLGSLADAAIQVSTGARKFEVFQRMSDTLRQTAERERRESFSQPVDAQRFFLQFEQAVRQVLGLRAKETNDSARLVVFIDDLDRCSDAVVFALLEAIKLYLSSRHCVFVFGLDRTHVEKAVAQAGGYTDLEAAQYVEKLFQTRLHLPVPDATQWKTFIEGLLAALDIRQQAAEVELLATLLPPNPRQAKNYLNGLKLHLTIGPKEEPRRAILVHLLRVWFPDVYELLLQNPKEVLEDLMHMCREESPGDTVRKQYIHHVMENPLMADTKADPKTVLDPRRFHALRAGAARAEALRTFKQQFSDTFPTVADLKAHLI
ncbi:MAG: hypothetical protein HQL82_00950 [Magnetococcales bacterium]|nr:hypothetical protein [Magnetococcales bacterium]